jgi:cation-transporting ATPase 13A1
MGIVVSMCFLFLSFAKPMPGLSAQRPYTTILCPYFFISVLAQFAVHLTLLVTCVNGAQSHMPVDVRPPATSPHLLSCWRHARKPAGNTLASVPVLRSMLGSL